MKKQLFIISAGFLCAFSAFSQNEIDAMRYSQLTFGGTARFASMAGSMGALGGDISTLSYNPAGIGIFRKTELSITPSIFSQTTSSTYNSVNGSDRKLNFNLGNIGLVATFKMKDTLSGWQNLNFGFGYNRSSNFHNRQVIQGYNKTSSLLDTYVAEANGNNPNDFDDFGTGMAWYTYLINPDSSGTNMYNHVITNYGQLQKKTIETSGSMGETVLSFGGNYTNKLFLGATLGIVSARYSEDAVYEEVDEKDTISDFNRFTYTESLESSGRGFNLKLGAIVKPTDWLRVGAAIHTPTTLSMKDNYSSSLTSSFDDGASYDTVSPQGAFNYRVTTPFRAIGSVGFVIKKLALINAEYEYVDYSYAQLHSTPNVFSEVNAGIRKNYTSTGNIRLGAEVRLDPISLRAGYALYGSPFRVGDNKTANRSSYTAGIGFRDRNFFIDFAYVLTKYTEYSYLYDPEILKSTVQNDYKNSSFMLTMGVRF
ncbi:MAG: outer membrane protein transport protein [Bacteroidota bacterium]|nr:outer membrane protein transport protein [Bacteroidota bacterium]